MEIIISDGCYIKSLQEVSLCGALIDLPYKIAVPDIVFEDMEGKLSNTEKSEIKTAVTEIIGLSGDEMAKVISLRREYPFMTVNASFSIVAASRRTESILLTDEQHLASMAEKISVHSENFLWLLREIHELGFVSAQRLIEAICILRGSSTLKLSQQGLSLFEKQLRAEE